MQRLYTGGYELDLLKMSVWNTPYGRWDGVFAIRREIAVASKGTLNGVWIKGTQAAVQKVEYCQQKIDGLQFLLTVNAIRQYIWLGEPADEAIACLEALELDDPVLMLLKLREDYDSEDMLLMHKQCLQGWIPRVDSCDALVRWVVCGDDYSIARAQLLGCISHYMVKTPMH